MKKTNPAKRTSRSNKPEKRTERRKTMTDRDLAALACHAMTKAYAPYSRFQVGAALLCADGTVYTGCNIENAAYGPTVCAERVAFFSAVRDGEREFVKIAVVGGLEGKIVSFTHPCGVCRQVMREFCRDDFEILAFDGKTVRSSTLIEMLPDSFSPSDLSPSQSTKEDDPCA
ncbi:MAG: cytidine deaminase [Ruminococcaceae bacterium]|nr:cytidine deaminase [Oscillospiraceae bacterium]